MAAAAPAMDAIAVLVVAWRRWYVTFLGLALTVAAASYLAINVDPTYQVEGSFLLASPALRGEVDAENVASTVADGTAIAAAVVSHDVAEQVAPQDPDAAISIEPSADGRLLHITANASAPETSLVLAEAAIDSIDASLDERQDSAGVPSEQRRTLKVLSMPRDNAPTLVEEDGSLPKTPSAVAYAAFTSVLIVDPLDSLENPYASSSFTTRVLEEVMTASARRAALLSGPTANYDVGQRQRDTAPILYVTATGSRPEEATTTFDRVAAELAQELRGRQITAGVRPERQISLEPLAPRTSAELASTNLLRPVATVIGLGGIITLVLVLLIDRFMSRRR